MPVVTERRSDPRPVDRAPGLPHAVGYSLIGAILALGSPIGAVLLRAWTQRPEDALLWLESELSANRLLYWYMAAGTAAAFSAFGWFVGRRIDKHRARNASLQDRVEELRITSITDGLTGAYSHAYIRETLHLELAAERRRRRPISVLMIDIDDFKGINDTHGHLFGDRVLATVASTLDDNIREADILGRYGGEEFLVVMPGADLDTAYQVAERVRTAVEALLVPDGGVRVAPRVSIGGATCPDGEEEPMDLLRRADERLYAAKRQGKNRTAV